MEDIRYVIDELNRAPFLKGYNLLAYDALRPDQRLDLLIELLNIIDPKLALPSARGGSGVAIEETIATILEQLRIFKFRVPFEYGSGSSGHENETSQGDGADFRRDLLFGDKDLHTLLLKWLFERASALKKRAYLARFLVKIDIPPELEGDHDVVTLYQQYQKTIEEFKKSHAASDAQKRSLDALIELQRDIHSMEIERDQVKSKLEAVKRRVDTSSSKATAELFEATKRWASARAVSDKLAKQSTEQTVKLTEIKRQLQESRAKLLEHKTANNVENITGNGLIEQLKDEITIQRRSVGTHLTNELEDLRSTVEDMETIAVSGENESVLQDYLSRIESQIELLEVDVRSLVDKKLMIIDEDEKKNENKKAVYYRRNAKTVATKREKLQKEVTKIEAIMHEEEDRLNTVRNNIIYNNQLGDMRGEALNVAIERWTNREIEMQHRLKELRDYENEVNELETKAKDLHLQDVNTVRTITEYEDHLSINGYFAMKELSLFEQPVESDPDGDGLEGVESEDASGVEGMNVEISKLQSKHEKIRLQLGPLIKEVKQQKQQLNEMESELGMKKRLYESAAAGLEVDIALQERNLQQNNTELIALNEIFQTQKTQEIIAETTRDWFLSDSQTIIDNIQNQVEIEEAQVSNFQQKQHSEADNDSKRHHISTQIEMWRNIDVLLEIKMRIFQKQKQRESNQNETTSTISSIYNHLVL